MFSADYFIALNKMGILRKEGDQTLGRKLALFSTII